MPLKGHISILAAASASAATRTSGTFYAHGNKGIIIRVTTDNGASTPSFTPSLQAIMENSSGGTDAVTVWTAAAAITTDTDSTYLLYPGAANGNFTEVDGIPLPNVFRLVLTRNTGNADTFVTGMLLG